MPTDNPDSSGSSAEASSALSGSSAEASSQAHATGAQQHELKAKGINMAALSANSLPIGQPGRWAITQREAETALERWDWWHKALVAAGNKNPAQQATEAVNRKVHPEDVAWTADTKLPSGKNRIFGSHFAWGYYGYSACAGSLPSRAEEYLIEHDAHLIGSSRERSSHDPVVRYKADRIKWPEIGSETWREGIS